MNRIQKTAAELLSRATTFSLSPRAIHRALLLHEDVYATTLILLVLDDYGKEALDWHPETIRRQLERDYSLKLPKSSLDKIMAAVVLLTTNYFYKDVVRFIELCNILSGDDFQPDEFDPADAFEIMWATVEAVLLYPPNDDPDDTEFSAEIRTYIGQVLKQDGVASPPDVLRLGLGADAANHIDANFADDPEMFQGIWEVQNVKRDELVETVRFNLQELATQLGLLRLQGGSTDQLLKQIQQVAQELPTSGQTT